MEWIRVEATLPVGSKGGVQPGMAFHVVDPQGFAAATVTSVRDEDCTVEFREYVRLGAKGVEPQPGWKLSTRHWLTPITPTPIQK
jgi:hypothetical protein